MQKSIRYWCVSLRRRFENYFRKRQNVTVASSSITLYRTHNCYPAKWESSDKKYTVIYDADKLCIFQKNEDKQVVIFEQWPVLGDGENSFLTDEELNAIIQKNGFTVKIEKNNMLFSLDENFENTIIVYKK